MFLRPELYNIMNKYEYVTMQKLIYYKFWIENRMDKNLCVNIDESLIVEVDTPGEQRILKV